jgi:phage shock protein PspC (stress-responsive transcriptional regulator)
MEHLREDAGMEQTHTTPLERPRTGRVLTGVTGALASRTGIDRRWIRAAFVLMSFAAGLGVVAYAISTVSIKSEGEEHTPFQQWIVRFDRAESLSQKLGWWLLTTLMVSAVATASFLQGPFVVLSLLALAGWLLSRPAAHVELGTV